MAETATPPITLRFTVKNIDYDVQPTKITGRERLEIKQLMGVSIFAMEDCLADDIGRLALAYLAVKRRNPNVSWDDMLDLAADEIEGKVVNENGDEADPFAADEQPASKAKTASTSRSPKD